MKAMVRDAYCSPDSLEFVDVEPPTAGPDEVLVRVRAAGVDQGVWHLVTGLPYPVRAAGFGLRKPKVRGIGQDLAGRVEAVGANVTEFRPGDEVFGTGEGAFAEYVSTKASRLAPKPANLTFEQAAAVPTSGFAALQAVRDKAKVRAGQRVLVLGAGGGVGTFAVQLAKSFGAEVTGVCGTAKVELVRSIGADHVLDYTREDFASQAQRYDVILDTGGNRPLADLRRVLTSDGTLVLVGAEVAGKWLGGTDRMLRALALSPFVRQRLSGLLSVERAADLEHLRELLEAGTITAAVDRTFPLSASAEAIRYLREGRARGKVVLTV